LEKNQAITVGKILEKLRKSQLLKQEDLADFSKRDRRTISDFERDKYYSTLEILFHLAAAFAMKPSELIKEIEKTEENAQYFIKVTREAKEKKIVHKKNRDTQKEV